MLLSTGCVTLVKSLCLSEEHGYPGPSVSDLIGPGWDLEIYTGIKSALGYSVMSRLKIPFYIHWDLLFLKYSLSSRLMNSAVGDRERNTRLGCAHIQLTENWLVVTQIHRNIYAPEVRAGGLYEGQAIKVGVGITGV